MTGTFSTLGFAEADAAAMVGARSRSYAGVHSHAHVSVKC